MKSRCLFLLSLLLVLTAVSHSQANRFTPKAFVPQMQPVVAHMKWTERDGAPGNIVALAQTTDGYLWLGTPFGLYRFDGTEFSHYPTTPLGTRLPSNDISALAADGEGGLWIGFRLTGGICHLARDGALAVYSAVNGLGPQAVLKIVVRKNGSVWALADDHLLLFDKGRWTNFGATHGLADQHFWSLFFDSRGNIWTSVRKELLVLHPGDRVFAPYPTKTFIVVDLAETPDGQIWISDGWRFVRPLVPSSANKPIFVSGYTRLSVDPSGTLWMGHDYRGLKHLKTGKSAAGQSELVIEGGLSSQQTDSLFRDRDGDIWVGTSRGLDRFQSSPLKALRNTRVEYYPALSSDPKSGVWINLLAHPLVHAFGDSLVPVGREIGSSPIFCDERDRVWLVDPFFNVLTEYDHGHMVRYPVPDEVDHQPAQSLVAEDDGALLVSFEEKGLWRFNGSWTPVTDAPLPREYPLTMLRDSAGRVWFGYTGGRIAVRSRERIIQTFATGPQGTGLGDVLAFAATHGRLWAAGSDGVAYLAAGSFRRLILANGFAPSGVSGIVEDTAHDLWLNTSSGVIRIRASELEKLTRSSVPLNYDVLDTRQGLDGIATQSKPMPSAVADKKGLLWFAVSGAVYSLDPASLSLSRAAPLLSLERVLVNGTPVMDREHGLAGIEESAASLRDLEFDYVGISLAAPEKVTYQYMLVGEDKTWRDVGARRQAFYTRLRPGKYSFRLRASNDLGAWHELAAPLTISIKPAIYQTTWFYGLIGVAVFAMLYVAYLLRVQYLTRLLKGRLKDRSDERLRIARALHDTLLQSVHGLMLRFHFVTETLTEGAPARRALETALLRADAVYLEARREVESLRDEGSHAKELVTLIATKAQEIEIDQSLSFRIVEDGQRQALNAIAQAELCSIACEALANTLLHAQAHSAEVVLAYGRSQFTMKCCDTGVGLPPAVLANGQRAGHWGLIGMKERAANLKGKLQIWSSGEGTEIEVTVPARRAYVCRSVGPSWLHRWLRFQRSATGTDVEA